MLNAIKNNGNLRLNNKLSFEINGNFNIFNKCLSYQDFFKGTQMIGWFLRVHGTFHNLSLNNSMRHLSKLAFTESLIYKWDQSVENEMREYNNGSNWNCPKPWPVPLHFINELDNFESNINEYGLLLASYLKSIDCYNDKIEKHIIEGNRYLKLEPILCHICSNKGTLSLGNIQMNKSLVKHTQYLRSADFRILHNILSILMQSTNNSYSTAVDLDGIMKFLKYENALLEIEEDILGYHKDVVNNTMNSYRCFVRMYGDNAPDEYQKYIDEMESKAQKIIDQDIIDRETILKFQYLMENEYHPWNSQRGRFPFKIPIPIINEYQFRDDNKSLLKTLS